MSWNTKLKWDQNTERLYETGLRRGVLFLKNDDGTYANGIAWNGLTSVSESPSGAESNPIYADDMKYLDIRSAEEFGATVQAYTYPDQFALCDGSADLVADVPGLVAIGQQARRAFGLCYQTRVGNDVKFNDYSYKLHLLYGCTASPSEREYQTVNDSPEAVQFSWELTTTPIELPASMGTFKPTASLVIDVSKIAAMPSETQEEQAKKQHYLDAIEAIEKKLYGVEGEEGSNSTLVLPNEIPTLITPYSI